MIVDCHTHLYQSPASPGKDRPERSQPESETESVSADPAGHALSCRCVDKALVMGLQIQLPGIADPNEYVADYVARHSDKTIGIAAVDPTGPEPAKTAGALLDRGEFRGLTVSPADQNFHPSDSRAIRVYELACRREVPVFFHQGPYFPRHSRMEHARPFLLDEIAREYPTLTMVICSLGYPWPEQCISLLAKHPNVYADTAGLTSSSWAAYCALALADQFGVMDKILFASDFPHSTAAGAIENLYRLREITQGTNLPAVPREMLRSVIERDALTALGIARPVDAPTP